MPRPIRIEYEDAYYHVMNRGRNHETIFHSKEYYQAFLKTLEEAHQRFGVQILCYCLMSNHYHLLIKTPNANLGRAMRHINGVYTQRHNRLKKTDGPLFRGRYKAIVVEEDSYQLQLSRYIHLNPKEAGVSKNIELFPWSSYAYYIKSKKTPAWLYTQEILRQMNSPNRARDSYRAYVELGVDEEIKQFYGKKNLMPYLGSEAFRTWAYSQKITEEAKINEQDKFYFRPDMNAIIQNVARMLEVSVDSIVEGKRGKENIPRWIAMYLCREKGGHRHIDIARQFGVKRSGSVVNTIAKLEVLFEIDKNLKNKIMQI